jgi:hypothetical protein
MILRRKIINKIRNRIVDITVYIAKCEVEKNKDMNHSLYWDGVISQVEQEKLFLEILINQ